MNTPLFDFAFQAGGYTDPGKKRMVNDDRIVMDSEHGFFAVTDGMGGLRCGNAASAYVSESLPGLMELCVRETEKHENPEEASARLKQLVCVLSDRLYENGNAAGRFEYGATLAGVWLFGNRAVFVGLGDSRGYLLKKDAEGLRQVTEDMNIAGLMLRNGLMSVREAAASPARSRLTAFVGMEAPATPEVWVETLEPGDCVLLCSDGLYSMVKEETVLDAMRSGQSPEEICRELIRLANENGGKDNISAVLVRVE